MDQNKVVDQQTKVKMIIVTTVPLTLWAFFRGQIDYVKSRGFDVSAVSSPGPELDEVSDREGIAIYPLPMVRGIALFADFVALIKMWRLLRREKPVILHAHTPKAGMLAMLAGMLAGIPVRIYTIHGLRFSASTGFASTVVKWMEKLTYACAHKVYSVSFSARDLVTELGLVSEDKCKVLLKGSINGIDTDRFNRNKISEPEKYSTRARYNIPEDAIVLGFMGRIVRDKGVHELIEAWEQLKETFPELHLLMVGPFEPEDPIDESVKNRIENDPRIHLTGFISDPVEAYGIMDILALPTYREGFPYAPLEAAAMEIPVVATKVTGCVDAVVDGKTGILVEARDAVALHDAISSLVKDKEIRKNMGKAARERCIQDYCPENIWDAQYREYLALLNSKGISIPEIEEGSQSA